MFCIKGSICRDSSTVVKMPRLAKYEIRSTKFETISKSKCPKFNSLPFLPNKGLCACPAPIRYSPLSLSYLRHICCLLAAYRLPFGKLGGDFNIFSNKSQQKTAKKHFFGHPERSRRTSISCARPACRGVANPKPCHSERSKESLF